MYQLRSDTDLALDSSELSEARKSEGGTYG
jgi:hypothetical protein